MTKFLSLLFLIPTLAFAASPAFSGFNSSQFGTNPTTGTVWAKNGFANTNTVITSGTNFGSTARTNWTWTSLTGWWNTNSSATNQSVNIQKGNIYVDDKIGIRTTSPAQALDVNGNSVVGRASGASFAASALIYQENGTGYSGFQQRGTASSSSSGMGAIAGLSEFIASSSGGLGIYTLTGTPLLFGTTDAIRMLIEATGKVGIGKTNPTANLHVVGSVAAAPVNANAQVLRLESSQTAAVGIGPAVIFRGKTGNATADYGFGAIQGAKESAVAENYGGYLAFFNQNQGGSGAFVENMRLTSAGNFGINTTTPAERLHVNGNAIIQTNLFVTNVTSSIGGLKVGTSGTTITNIVSATAALDFGNILAAASGDLTITVTGAKANDGVFLGLPVAPNASLVFNAFVSAADTVTVRAFNVGAIAVDQASMTFRVVVNQF